MWSVSVSCGVSDNFISDVVQHLPTSSHKDAAVFRGSIFTSVQSFCDTTEVLLQ